MLHKSGITDPVTSRLVDAAIQRRAAIRALEGALLAVRPRGPAWFKFVLPELKGRWPHQSTVTRVLVG